MKVYYLGPVGSFSHIVAKKLFPQENLYALSSFFEIVSKTKLENGSIGILPVENSITSDVHENIDYIFDGGLRIKSEAFLKIHLHLIGFKDATKNSIQKVISHPKAISQSSEFISINKFEKEFCESTSRSKSKLLELNDKQIGIIGSRELVDDELEIIASNIENNQYNITRFLLVESDKSEINQNNRNKLTILFKVKHEPGSLASVLSGVAELGINVLKIESRPIPGTTWEYQFWMDVELTESMNQIFLEKMKDLSLEYKVIGFYKRGELFES